eukprot:gene7801-9601_t
MISIDNNNNDKKTVVIVGGGVSGITSCKMAAELGLIPTVLERNSTIGGTWSTKDGRIWESMRTNISRYSFMFSDFPSNAELFLSGKQADQYLQDYIDHFNIRGCFNLNCTVSKVSRHGESGPNQKWKVDWIDNTNSTPTLKSQVFDYAIISSGFFSSPCPIPTKGIENFTGETSNSQEYRNPRPFQGKRVAVIGNSFSGCEVASDLITSGSAKSVVQITRRVPWIVERRVQKDGKVIPLDVYYFNRVGNNMATSLPTEEERNRFANAFFGSLTKQLESPDLQVGTPLNEPPQVVVSDNYVKYVMEKKLKIRKDRDVEKIDGLRIYFKNNNTQDQDQQDFDEVDHIINCTGYQLRLDFFDQDILDELYFQPTDLLQPVLLHRSVWAPTLHNMGFVGIFKGVFLPCVELQARWVCQVFAGVTPLPTDLSIEKEKSLRSSSKGKPQFPHGNYVDFCDYIAKEIGALPNFDELQKEDTQLYHQVWNNLLSPSSYRLHDKPLIAKKILNEIDQLFYSK